MKRLVLGLLRGYKWLLSPLLLPSCRYVPTCSEYAMEAVERYGALRGGAMAAWRLLRCHPLVKGGWDPVGGTRRSGGTGEVHRSFAALRMTGLEKSGNRGKQGLG